jgi:hypothetical protein
MLIFIRAERYRLWPLRTLMSRLLWKDTGLTVQLRIILGKPYVPTSRTALRSFREDGQKSVIIYDA